MLQEALIRANLNEASVTACATSQNSRIPVAALVLPQLSATAYVQKSLTLFVTVTAFQLSLTPILLFPRLG